MGCTPAAHRPDPSSTIPAAAAARQPLRPMSAIPFHRLAAAGCCLALPCDSARALQLRATLCLQGANALVRGVPDIILFDFIYQV